MVGRAFRVKLGSGKRANGSHGIDGLVMAEMIREITEDLIYGGRIKVRQPRHGYRVNADTILLAAAIEADDGAHLLEAGCGVGAASLAVAARLRNISIVGIERDQNIAELARENVATNAMSSRVEIVTGDVLERSANIGVFDGVFFNPPFDEPGEGRAPAETRRDAHVSAAPLDVWISAMSNRLRGDGVLTLIQRVAKLPEIIAALEGRLGGVEIFPIRPRAGEPAKRILVRARKGSRAPLRLLNGLNLHDGSPAKHTPETEAILRGDTAISWG